MFDMVLLIADIAEALSCVQFVKSAVHCTSLKTYKIFLFRLLSDFIHYFYQEALNFIKVGVQCNSFNLLYILVPNLKKYKRFTF